MERITDDAGRDRVMNVSDDGHVLAYIASRSGHDAMWLRQLDVGREREIADVNAVEGRVNPDGTIVAIRHPGPRHDTWLVSAHGGHSVSLCEDCEPGGWSPDGSRIIIGIGNPERLFVHEVLSGRDTPLAAHPQWNLLQPRFSPDGRWVIFHTMNGPTVRQIYAVPANTGRPVAFDEWIPIVTDFGMHPSWSPDGHARLLLFAPRRRLLCLAATVGSRDHAPRGCAARRSAPARASAAGRDQRGDHQRRARRLFYVTLTEATANIWMMRTGRPPRSGGP